MKRKTIHVTEKDIENGERGSYCNCPIALAVKRAFRRNSLDENVTVRHEFAMVGDSHDDLCWIAMLPKSCDRFVDRFDAGKTVKPFEITLSFI